MPNFMPSDNDVESVALTDPVTNEVTASGVSWPAVIAGAFGTAALSLILLQLGSGLGLASVSPWRATGASTATIGAGAIIWFIFIQIVAGATGGYLAGRLRTKWSRLHTDEVYFRDTAHGFLAWCVAFVITAAFLTSAAIFMTGQISQGGAAADRSGTAQTVTPGPDPNGYYADSLFRSERPNSTVNDQATRAEAGRILANALQQKELPARDNTYLTQLVSAKTGMSESDAGKRVSDVFASAQEAADATRRALAHLLIWGFVGLLIGAFCASYAATIGGRLRDHLRAV